MFSHKSLLLFAACDKCNFSSWSQPTDFQNTYVVPIRVVRKFLNLTEINLTQENTEILMHLHQSRVPKNASLDRRSLKYESFDDTQTTERRLDNF